jgi:hypothetical protein
MENFRYSLSELARETNTCRTILYNWINKGYLKYSQIAGTRKKYTLRDFETAERLSKKDFESQNNSAVSKNESLESFYDNLDKYIQEIDIAPARAIRTLN